MLLGCVGAFWAHQCCCEDRSWAEVDFVREPRVSRGPQLVITAHDFRLVRGREGMYHCVGGRMLMAGGGLREEEHVQDTHTFWGWGMGITKCHASHELMQVELFPHIYWCNKCRAISSHQAKMLCVPCRGTHTKWGGVCIYLYCRGISS